LSCPTDVVSGESDSDLKLQVFDRWEKDGGFRPLSWVVDTDPLSAKNLELLDGLRGAFESLTPGCQLAYRDRAGDSFYGTLACFARDRASGLLGFLTNQHVGDFPGNSLWFPDLDFRGVGSVVRNVLEVNVRDRYDLTSTARGTCKVDAGFCELAPSILPAEVNFQLPLLEASPAGAGTEPETLVFRQLGTPRPLDLDTLGPLGEAVIGVGRTRGFQRGLISSFAFEFRDEQGRRHFSDYQIVGEGSGEFSDPGNSGTLIVTSSGLEPVALLWGGAWARRRRGRALENWTEATDINLILDLLEIEIVA
jgi:hypothetical protein